MKKGDFATNPLTGSKVNFSIGGVLGMVVGGALLLLVFDVATNLKNKVRSAIPGNVPLVGAEPTRETDPIIVY